MRLLLDLLIALITLASLVVLVVGLVRPRLFGGGRQRVLALSGGLFAGAIVALVVVGEPPAPKGASDAAPTQAGAPPAALRPATEVVAAAPAMPETAAAQAAAPAAGPAGGASPPSRGSVQPVAPAPREEPPITTSPGSAWLTATVDFQTAFNAASARAGYRLQMGPVFCAVGPMLECRTDVSGVAVRIAATDRPERVVEAGVVLARGTPNAMLLATSHVLLEIAEPHAPRADRAAAVLGVLGVGDAPRHSGIVANTRLGLRPVEGFQEMLVLQPAGR